MRLFLSATRLALALFAGAAFAAPTGSVHVTGQFRVINGSDTVPVGLFGVHATALTPETAAEWGVESVRTIEQKPDGKPINPGEDKRTPVGIGMVVECFYDRYQPALMLTDRSWKEKLETLAKTYATNASGTGRTHTIEFWNEPYLNWAKKPGVNYDGALYEPGEDGTAMTIKGESKPLDSLVWSKQLVAVDENTGKVDYLASSYALPLVWNGKLKEGDEYIFREAKTFRIESRPWGRDPGQTSWFSGPQNAEFYRRMFIPFARTIKETNPAVQVVAGWGFHINQDDWVAWPVLFKPLIDESIPWLDGIDEHHYGGDTRRVAGSYEVVSAYAQSEHGKRLKFYNTEAGGALDPERPDAPAAPNFQANAGSALFGAFTYMLRDVIHLIDICPDKAVARASHMADKNGDRFALKFLKDLRGRLLAVDSDVANVWTVASMRGHQICVVAYNDNSHAKSFLLRVDAPAGWRLVSGRVENPRRVDDLIEFQAEEVFIRDGMFEETIEMQGRSAKKWVFECAKNPGESQPGKRVETQYFARGIINRLSPAKPVELEIKIPAAALSSVTATQLKIVQEGWNPDCVFTLNGQEIKLDVINSWTHIQPIDPALLRPVNKFVFQTRSGKPVTIDMASIVTLSSHAAP